MDDGLSDLGSNELGGEIDDLSDLSDLSNSDLSQLNELHQLTDCLMLDRAIHVIQQVCNRNVLNTDAFHSRFTTLTQFTHRLPHRQTVAI